MPLRIAVVYPHSIIPVPRVELFDALAIVTYEVARRLAKEHEVIVYPRRGPGENRIDRHESVTFRRISVAADQALSGLKLLDRLGITRPERPYRLTSLYYLGYALQVALDLRRRKCDVVHVYGITNFIPVIRYFNPEARVVLHSQDHALVDFDRDLTEHRLQGAALILGCSEFVTENIRQRFPSLAGRCHALHNGVDRRFLAVDSRPRDSETVLFIGRLSPEKGVHVLLDAFAELAADHPRATLQLVGPHDVAPKQFVDPFRRDPLCSTLDGFYTRPRGYLEHLQGRAAALGDRVGFGGAVANDAITRYHAEAGLFVFPSVWQEPFGIPLIEAMAAGLPVVATRAGAFPEIVADGVTGLLVERGDRDALAAAIRRLLADPDLRARMGAAGRERARALFSWDRSVARLVEFYRSCAPPRRDERRRAAVADARV